MAIHHPCNEEIVIWGDDTLDNCTFKCHLEAEHAGVHCSSDGIAGDVFMMLWSNHGFTAEVKAWIEPVQTLEIQPALDSIQRLGQEARPGDPPS